MSVNIYEAGSDNEARGVNFLKSLFNDLADGDYAPITHADVARTSLIAAAVDHHAITNH